MNPVDRARIEREKLLTTLYEHRGKKLVKSEVNQLSGFDKSYNSTQRFKILISHGYVATAPSGRTFGNVEELTYTITAEGEKYVAENVIRHPAPNFDLFKSENSPIASLLAEIKEMQDDLERIKAITAKYMDC